MEAYKRWVRGNKEYVHSLESLANGHPPLRNVRVRIERIEAFIRQGLTWLLPERFSDSEIGPEAVTAILGIVTAVNEHIIDTNPTQIHTGSSQPSSFPYSLCITLLKDLETLVEVVAQHFYGDDKKWNFIAVTEFTKVLVRLALFWNSGYKMLLHGGEIPNVEKSSDALDPQHRFGHLAKPGWHQGPGNLKNYHEQNPWNLEGRALSALSRFGENARMVSEPTWLRRVQHEQAMTEPLCVLGGLYMMGEVMFITRPLVYVLLIRKYGIRSWFPWFVSLVVDLVGVGILLQVTMSGHRRKDQQFHLSSSEKDEVKRRRLLWALYLMRDPFFSKYTRQRLERTEKLLEPVPIVGFLTAKIIELIIGAQTRYTYMSGS